MTAALPLLFGKFLSPYVRRVGVSLNILGFAFERSIISAVEDETAREAVNPVGRVPALRLASGEILIDSAAILDHLDALVGPGRALLPGAGLARRRALQHIALATGAIDRAMTANTESRRKDPDKERIARMIRQCQQGFDVLERALGGRELFDRKKLQQTDITAAIGFNFVNHIFPGTLRISKYPHLANLSERCEAMEAFQAAAIETLSHGVIKD